MASGARNVNYNPNSSRKNIFNFVLMVNGAETPLQKESVWSWQQRRYRNYECRIVFGSGDYLQPTKSRIWTFAMPNCNALCVRLGPGEDLLQGILQAVADAGLSSAWIMTCVGSLTQCKLRLANAEAGKANDIVKYHERFEILSLVGTVSSKSQSCHVHISLGDKDGKVVGGHLMGECEVFTTAEIVLGYSEEMTFRREMDARTGFDELTIHPCTGSAAASDKDRTLRSLALLSISLGILSVALIRYR